MNSVIARSSVSWVSILLCVFAMPARSASNPSGSAATDPKTTAGNAELSFSIESEMLTYRALESNSEAVACDVAAYLNGSAADFKIHPPGAICGVNKGDRQPSGVLVAPFDRTLFDDFRFWRAELELMRELQERADLLCPDSDVLAVESRGAGASKPAVSVATVASAAGKAVLSSTPAGTALQIAQGLLGMAANVPSSTAVAGTIQDQAFINGVARELRSLNVAVLVPFTYAPYSLSPSDVSSSPFLEALHKLLVARSCLGRKAAARETSAAQKSAIEKLESDIEAYTASFRGELTQSKQTETVQAGSPSPKTPPSGSTAPAPGPNAQTVLQAVLGGDDFARMLGVDPATGLLRSDSQWQHVLLLKALESGGSVERSGSVFGSSVHYSGGSVTTYALFSLDGRLECSGNVYEYGGSISGKSFEEELRKYVPQPQSQFIFQRGSCGASASR